MKKNIYPSISQGFGVLGIVVLGMVLFTPVISLENLFGSENIMLVYYLFAMGVPFWILWKIRKRKTGKSNFSFRSFDPKILPIIIIAPISIILGLTLPLVSLIPMPEFWKEVLASMPKGQGLSSFLMVVIAGPILEELIFRGIILDGFLQRYSPAKAIVISSILFGLVHLNPWQFVTGLVLGSFAGWVYYRMRSLWLPIIIHASNNFWAYISGFFFDFTSEDMNKSLIETYGGVFNAVLVLLSSWIVLAVCIYLLNRIFRQRQVIKAPYVQSVSHS